MVAVVGAKGGPGATTAVLALALTWPGRVLLVDADPAGGDVAAGWLGGTGLDRGLLGFAAATRHVPPAAMDQLSAAVAGQSVVTAEAPGVLLLPGLADAGQAAAVGGPGWTRLAAALTAAPLPGWDPTGGWVDVLVDAGRVGPGTPWPVLAAADVVLVAVRPTVRGCHHAGHALAQAVAGVGGPGRLGLLVCGPGPYPAREVGAALAAAVRVELPADPRAAAPLVDGGWSVRGLSRTLLLRAARGAAGRLHGSLRTTAPERRPAGGPPVNGPAGLVGTRR